MIYKGTLNKRDGELHVYLFDHALLFTKLVKTKQHEQFKVYRRVSKVCLAPRLRKSDELLSCFYLSKYSQYPLSYSISRLLTTLMLRMAMAMVLFALDIGKDWSRKVLLIERIEALVPSSPLLSSNLILRKDSFG
jgi:hypothetical protein